MSDTLKKAIEAVMSADKVDIKGKKYTTVGTRLEIFRQFYGHDFGIFTEVLPSQHDDIARVRAVITNGTGQAVASGLAQEDRNASRINNTSHMEVAETSAIGRALACFGLHGGEYASADEMHGAIEQEQRPVRQQQRDYEEMPPREREFRKAVDEAFPPRVSQFNFYVPPDNSPPEIDKVFMEIDRISNPQELVAYFHALEEWFQWLKPGDLAEVKDSFKSRKNQLKG